MNQEKGKLGDLIGIFMKYPKIWVVKDNEIGFAAPKTFFTKFENFDQRADLVSALKYFASAN